MKNGTKQTNASIPRPPKPYSKYCEPLCCEPIVAKSQGNNFKQAFIERQSNFLKSIFSTF